LYSPSPVDSAVARGLYTSVSYGLGTGKGVSKGRETRISWDISARFSRDRRVINHPLFIRGLFPLVFPRLTGTGLSYASSSNICWTFIVSHCIIRVRIRCDSKCGGTTDKDRSTHHGSEYGRGKHAAPQSGQSPVTICHLPSAPCLK
jgi:hypothetical protein